MALSANGFSDSQIMLTLAAISYRGFDLTALPEAVKRARMRAAMTDSLDQLATVRGEWDIVWGPASFTSSLVGFDDSAMYVAKRRGQPTFAIAIRGTNPVSLFDWVFGDLAVGKTIAWPYGTPADGGAISVSSALGLAILQHLSYEAAAAPVADPAGPTLLLDKLKERLDAISGFLRSTANTGDLPVLEEWAAGLRKLRLVQAGTPVLRLLDAKLTAQGAQGLDPVAMMMNEIEQHAALAPGIDLRTFLANTVNNSQQPVNIFVTGHSKGGALCSTLALWLADTQGQGSVPEDERWDIEGKATVYCYSFAGPTAGNTKFADYSNRKIGDRCWRIANRQDIVPHAWSDIAGIPPIYGSAGAELALLQTSCAAVASDVASLGYKQVGNEDKVDEFTSPLAHDLPFLGQAIHQHLDAYLEHESLTKYMNTATFFTPVL
jgi:hypothetical protein